MGHEPPANKGTIIVDATCAPSQIKYPSNVELLNEAREKLETIFDVLYQPEAGKKPRMSNGDGAVNFSAESEQEYVCSNF